MFEFDALFTIAEISVGLVGVTGLVVAFMSKGRMHITDTLRFSLIVSVGFTTALLSFTPYWVSRFTTNPELVWQVSSCIGIATFVIFALATRSSVQKHLETVERLIAQVSPALRYGPPVMQGTSVILYVTNAISWPIESNSTFYEIALFIGIGYMMFLIAVLVVVRYGDEDM